MRPTSFKHGFSAGNPVANVFVIIAGALIIGVSVVLGFVAFLILSAIVLITAAAIGLRVWWFGRKLRRQQGGAAERPDTGQAKVIEGEYRVVDDGRDEP